MLEVACERVKTNANLCTRNLKCEQINMLASSMKGHMEAFPIIEWRSQ